MTERRGRVGNDAANYVLLSLTLGGVVPRDMENPAGKFPASFETYKIVQPDDLVFCLFDIDETPRAVGLAKQAGMVTGAYDVFAVKDVNPQFLYYYYLHIDNGKLLKPLYTGLRKTVQRGTFSSLKTPIPPAEEQAAIVRYLDWACGRLDRTIRATRRVIVLLNEQKEAIIHRAVTRGLVADVSFKPSPIEGIEEIPAYWDTPLNQINFRECVRSHNGRPEQQLSLSQRTGLIATSEMQERSLQTSSFENWKVTIPGDLVLNRFKAHLGVFFCATLRGIVSFHYGVFAPRRNLNTKYFELLFHTAPYRAIYAGRSNGMTVGLQNLSNQNFYGVRSLFPPVEEQNRIVDFCTDATSGLYKAIRQTRHEMDVIVEYRTRLIADVVTGKLDVREAAAKLPTEDIPEIPDEASDEESTEVVEELAEAVN